MSRGKRQASDVEADALHADATTADATTADATTADATTAAQAAGDLRRGVRRFGPPAAARMRSPRAQLAALLQLHAVTDDELHRAAIAEILRLGRDAAPRRTRILR